MFSNTLSFLSSRKVSDQVSHPYNTTGTIIVLYILIFKFLDSNLEDRRLLLKRVKCKAVPLQAWSGPEVFQELKVPRFHDNGTG